MRISTWLLALSLLLSGPALAEPAPAAPKPAEAPQKISPATAAALARVVAPLEVGVAAELEQARKAILVLPTVDEDAKQLEQEFPGIYAAMWTAVEPEMRRSIEADYPAFWAALEEMYLGRLTENEAHAVMIFFNSPTGQKLLRNSYSSFDAAPIVAEMAKSDNYTMTEKQMQSATDAAKKKAVADIGPEDQADLWILMKSIDLKKFQSLGAETQKVTLAWVNKEDPEADARLGKVMEEAMEQYIADHPSKE